MHQQTREVIEIDGDAPTPAQRRAGFGVLISGPHFTNRAMRRRATAITCGTAGEKVRKIAARKAKQIRIARRRAAK